MKRPTVHTLTRNRSTHRMHASPRSFGSAAFNDGRRPAPDCETRGADHVTADQAQTVPREVGSGGSPHNTHQTARQRTRWRFGICAALVLLMAAVAPNAFTQVVRVQPEARTFDLGELKISVLRDSALVFPNDGAIFGVNAGPAAVAKVLRQAGARTDTIRLDVDTLLVRMPKHLVLIDAGYGMPNRSVVPQSLSLIGVSPDDVTDVLVTHAHPDHVGGLVDAEHRSAFPKATIWMSAKAWAFMHHEADVRTEVPVINAQVKTFEPGHLVLPGITSVALPGHTPGQVGYVIASQGDQLIDTGDIAHSSIISLAKPGWTLAWDSNKSEAITTRSRELQRLADTHELMFAPHFPFPGVGRIEADGDGFRFQPARCVDENR